MEENLVAGGSDRSTEGYKKISHAVLVSQGQLAETRANSGLDRSKSAYFMQYGVPYNSYNLQEDAGGSDAQVCTVGDCEDQLQTHFDAPNENFA
jgi:hypothetical protein